jgi:IMP dehydrogenase
MDGVVDPRFAVAFHRQRGLAVLNLEGLHGRYADPGAAYRQIGSAGPQEAPALLQRLYESPIEERFVRRSVREAKQAGARIAVSATPLNAHGCWAQQPRRERT